MCRDERDERYEQSRRARYYFGIPVLFSTFYERD
jgi:hypothetical protein